MFRQTIGTLGTVDILVTKQPPAKAGGFNLMMDNKFIKLAVLALIVVMLSGCIGGMLISTATRSGYGLYNDHTKAGKIANVIMGPGDMQRMRAQLVNANHVAILTDSEMAMSFADIWLDAGRQATVLLEHSNPSILSKKKVKVILIDSCKRNVDAAVFGNIRNRQAVSPSQVKNQIPAEMEANLYVYSCYRQKFESSSFIVDLHTKGQVVNNEIEQSIGAGLAAKLIEITR